MKFAFDCSFQTQAMYNVSRDNGGFLSFALHSRKKKTRKVYHFWLLGGHNFEQCEKNDWNILVIIFDELSNVFLSKTIMIWARSYDYDPL